MGKRGTKPQPTLLRVINGNPGKRPLNVNEPMPQGNLDAPPEWLTEAQKENWRYAIEHAPPGLLKFVDRSVLTIWVIADDALREASEKIAAHGMLIRAQNTGQPIQSPYMAIRNRQSQIVLKAAAEMGFTPSSRSQIQVQPQAGNAFANNGKRKAG